MLSSSKKKPCPVRWIPLCTVHCCIAHPFSSTPCLSCYASSALSATPAPQLWSKPASQLWSELTASVSPTLSDRMWERDWGSSWVMLSHQTHPLSTCPSPIHHAWFFDADGCWVLYTDSNGASTIMYNRRAATSNPEVARCRPQIATCSFLH
jgi:hypothetical protein